MCVNVSAIVKTRPTILSLLLACAITVGHLAAARPAAAQAGAEIRLVDDTILGPGSPAPGGRIPVLFVHGHKPSLSLDPRPNYVLNWKDPRDDTSFHDTLALAANSGLDIEPYYIDFADQDRSILEDANALGLAVERILARHDPGYDLSLPIAQRSTPVQLAIVAFSKGTISSRLYLKSLSEALADLPQSIVTLPPAERGLVIRPGSFPVSEFIAISPPNHALRPSSFFGDATAPSAKQLYNGYDENCNAYDTPPVPWVTDFYTSLNGYPLSGAANAAAADQAAEAPGSRPDGAPTHTGILYVALYAANGADFVGGDNPSANDCQDRGQARNLAADATNLQVSGITTGIFGSIDIHRNTVHHPDVICAALYTIVHHRAPAGPLGPLCQEQGGVPLIPLPARASVGLVLDFSGSMSLPACGQPGCAQRQQVLKDAAEIFMVLWSLLGTGDDRASITLFRNTATLLSDAGQTLFPLPVQGNVSQITSLFSSQSPAGSTAMGQGIRTGFDSLGPVTGLRRLLLVTDGLQNVAPLVSEQNGEYSIASTPAVDLSDADIPIDTIAIGDGAHAALLSAIAADTNGYALATNAPDEDLREFFIEQLISALRGFSPQMIGYRHGRVGAEGQASEAFSVNATPKKLAFKLSWDRGRTLNLKVERNGKDVTALGRIVSGPFYRIWSADPNKGAGVPPQGAWRMLVQGKPGSAYQAAAIVDEHDFSMDVTLTGKSRRAGEPQEITVQLLRGGQPFAAEFDVDVTLQVPKISVGTAISRFGIDTARLPKPLDPKESLGGRKLNALLSDPQFARLLRSGVLRSRLKHDGKGLYRGTFSGTEVPGTYRAVIEISGPDDAGGRLLRRTNAAVHIRFAGGEAALSDLKILSSRISGGRRIVELSLMPRDRFGNILGPDHGGEIAFGAGGTGRVDVANIIDFGDGRYLATLSLPPGGKPRLTISIAGADLFSGWLDSIR